MSRHDPLVRMLHMRDFAREALEMAAGRTEEDLLRNAMLRYALTHLVELVGEAAAQVPRETQSLYPQIPWPKVTGMRNRLIHGYDEVKSAIILDTIFSNLPGLVRELDQILGPAENPPDTGGTP